MLEAKRLLNTRLAQRTDTSITLDGASVPAATGELFVEAVNRSLPKRNLSQVCYLPQMGPIETCDTCMVEVDGELVRASATSVVSGMNVTTESARPSAAPCVFVSPAGCAICWHDDGCLWLVPKQI